MARDRIPVPNEDMIRVLEPYAGLFGYEGQYAWPPRGGDAERVSLTVHAARRAQILGGMEEPSGEELRWLLCKAVEAYRLAAWTLPEDFLTRAHFERMLDRLERKSSPGWPYCLDFPTIGDMIGGVLEPNWPGIEQLWNEVQARLDGKQAHPIRLFVKVEPHKRTKLEQGRYRLISSVCVVDQIIDHMLFSEQNDREIDVHRWIPSKPGWAPVRGGWRELRRFKTAVSCDKSLWDWGMPWWVAQCDLLVRRALCRNYTDAWWDLACRRYSELYLEARFITSDGQVFRQLTGGLQKSGCVNTISLNSRAQYFIHLLACRRSGEDLGQAFWAMGDDTLQERASSEYVRQLGKLCCVKEVIEGVQFAGTLVEDGYIRPAYAAKHFFSLLHAPAEHYRDIFDSYQRLYARDPRLDVIQRVVADICPEAWLPKVELRGWYDGLTD